ncbi:MAG: hypothetical protein VX619_09945 [bacterium]|nr:hypothetical protein [bacterium]
MQQVYIGPSHSMSWHGFDDEKTFESITNGRSPLSGIQNVIEEAQKNNVPGRIPWDLFKDFEIENKCVKNGPVEARYAYICTKMLLERFPQILDHRNDMGLYVGTMNNYYGLVGLRNGYRVCVNDQFTYDKRTFESKIGVGFSFVHPMVPVYKIPNNCVANIALDWELRGANANYFGEDSSSTALHESYLKIRSGRLKQTLTVTSNHLFLNYLDFLFTDLPTLTKKEPAKLIPEKDNFFFPSEWASSYLLCTEDQSEKLKVEKQARILASHQTSFQGVYMRRNLKRETVVQVVDACLKKAKLKFNDLDLVVFDNVDKDKSQIGALVTLREGGKTKLLTPSLFLGHPICANGGAMITTALMCLKHQKIFSSYLDSVPDEPELTAEEEEMNLNRILVLSQGLNNSLHGLILEKA